ncbi:MAG: response regulator [Candidatus Anammoxibacter sp.]
MHTLLVVDDEINIRHLLKKTFKDSYEVLTAKNGLEALSIIKNSDVNVVLLDYNMPILDGLETLKRTKEINDKISVVMFTADNNTELPRKSKEAGADGFILKPFDPDQIKILVADLLNKQREED